MDPQLQELLARVAELEARNAALEAENAELKKQALTDSLTGCLNRRAFDIALDKAISKEIRDGKKRFIAWFDLDKFKPINDQYGHKAGDIALQQFVAKMREADLLCRVGGDEFALIADGDENMFNIRMSKLQQEGVAFDYEGEQIHFTFSYAVKSLSPELDAEAVLLAVDNAMYQNKLRRQAAR